MNIEEKIKAILNVAEEVVTEDELRILLERKKIIAYDGFEPSGLAHLPVAVYRPALIKFYESFGFKYKILLADSFAWINNKHNGDLEKIKLNAEYFKEVWKASHFNIDVEFINHRDFFEDPNYWFKVLQIARHHSLNRTLKSLTIAGKTLKESLTAAQVFYPSMQCADIFHLKVDVCNLGHDQRKVNMLARDISSDKDLMSSFEYSFGVNSKPVVVSNHMLLGLSNVDKSLKGDEFIIKSKMSKSKPDTCIFVHDSEELINSKIKRAFCPIGVKENNPMLDYSKYIIFLIEKKMLIERPLKFGGDIEYESYDDLEKDFISKKIHPMDLKNAVAKYINKYIAPIRKHFENNRRANEIYSALRK